METTAASFLLFVADDMALPVRWEISIGLKRRIFQDVKEGNPIKNKKVQEQRKLSLRNGYCGSTKTCARIAGRMGKREAETDRDSSTGAGCSRIQKK